MMRARASASATREVSMVIHRRPHCSATVAVVPEPQVGSEPARQGLAAMPARLQNPAQVAPVLQGLRDARQLRQARRVRSFF